MHFVTNVCSTYSVLNEDTISSTSQVRRPPSTGIHHSSLSGTGRPSLHCMHLGHAETPQIDIAAASGNEDYLESVMSRMSLETPRNPLNTTDRTAGRPSSRTVASWKYFAYGSFLFFSSDFSSSVFHGAHVAMLDRVRQSAVNEMATNLDPDFQASSHCLQSAD